MKTTSEATTEAATDDFALSVRREVRMRALGARVFLQCVSPLEVCKQYARIGERAMTVEETALEQNIAYVKSVVSCADVAEIETPLRMTGGVYRGPCPVHGGSNPTSFCLVPNGEGFFDSFFCHSCGESGDVLDLAGHLFEEAGGGQRPVWAMEAIARRFGLTLVRDTDFLDDRQKLARKQRLKARRAFERGMVKHFFETEVLPAISAYAADEDEEKALLERCLKEAGL